MLAAHAIRPCYPADSMLCFMPVLPMVVLLLLLCMLQCCLPLPHVPVVSIALLCWRLHCCLTLRRNTEKRERRYHLCAVCLRKFPFVLLRLPPRLADTHCTALLAQLEHVSLHQAGVPKAEPKREHRGHDAKAQYRRVGCLVPLIAHCDVTGPQPSVGNSIGYDISQPHEDRADQLAHLSTNQEQTQKMQIPTC
jgi:hypothetical protein